MPARPSPRRGRAGPPPPARARALLARRAAPSSTRQSRCGSSAAAHARISAANTGERSSSSSAIRGHWPPWPGKTNTGAPPSALSTTPSTRRGEGLPSARLASPSRRSSPPSPITTPRWSRAVRVVASDQPTSSAGNSSCSERWAISRVAPSRSAGTVLAERTKGTGTEAPVGCPVSRCSAATAGSGAASTTTWQLVPPRPNELTPAIFGETSGHGSRAIWTRSPRSSSGISGFGCSKLRLGGISPRPSARTALISPAAPAAASRCPMFVFAEPTRSDEPSRPSPSTLPSAAASARSPSGVPVPCSSTYETWSGRTPAFS